MNIRLCGSFVITRVPGETCRLSKVADYLAQLPKHCFVQTLFPVESLDVVLLVYTTDSDFDLESWYENDFEM